MGRKYSALAGFSARALSRKAGNRARASSRKLRVKPHIFMDTVVFPGRGVQLCPPSSVKRASAPSFSMAVRSTMSRRMCSPSTVHTPRATEPCSVTVFFSR